MTVLNAALTDLHPFVTPTTSVHDRATQRLAEATRDATNHLVAGRLDAAADRLAPELGRLRSMAADELVRMKAHNVMGTIAEQQGDFCRAKRHYAKVARSRAAERDATLRAELEHNLAGLDRCRGELESAEHHSRAALAVWLERQGERHPDTLAELCQLGGILCERRRADQALQILLRAYDGLVDLHGPVHPEVGRATIALAVLRHRMGDLSIAECLYREGLALTAATGAADRPERAWTMVSLSVVVRRAGRPAEAERILDEAMAVLADTVAADHPLLVKLQQRRAA